MKSIVVINKYPKMLIRLKPKKYKYISKSKNLKMMGRN